MADGHLSPEPIENIYSGVVSLRNLGSVIFLGKLNNLDIWGADIGNACLEAFTDEKLLTCFYQCLRLCSCGTKPQRYENHHFVMTSSWEPQCHHDIIMRTPRITGKPKFSCSGGLQLKYPFFELGIKHHPQIY